MDKFFEKQTLPTLTRVNEKLSKNLSTEKSSSTVVLTNEYVQLS